MLNLQSAIFGQVNELLQVQCSWLSTNIFYSHCTIQTCVASSKSIPFHSLTCHKFIWTWQEIPSRPQLAPQLGKIQRTAAQEIPSTCPHSNRSSYQNYEVHTAARHRKFYLTSLTNSATYWRRGKSNFHINKWPVVHCTCSWWAHGPHKYCGIWLTKDCFLETLGLKI